MLFAWARLARVYCLWREDNSCMSRNAPVLLGWPVSKASLVPVSCRPQNLLLRAVFAGQTIRRGTYDPSLEVGMGSAEGDRYFRISFHRPNSCPGLRSGGEDKPGGPELKEESLIVTDPAGRNSGSSSLRVWGDK